jgi:transcription factor E
MQVKLLYDLIEELAGENTGRIVEILFGKKDVNEFLIAKKMELTINQVRNILYKLSADNLVSFVRKKDKRKGWYIYYWTLNREKCLAKLWDSLNRKIDRLNGILHDRETKRFYICKSCDIEVTEEKALENGFSCEECADIYELQNNSKSIRETKATITKTRKSLELTEQELNIEKKRKATARKRAATKAKNEEKARKALVAQARAATKKKVAKKVVKKVVKKKVAKVVKKAVKKKVVKKVSLASRLKRKISGGV